MTFKVGDVASVPMFARTLEEAQPGDWCDVILLNYSEGGGMLYPLGGGEPYPMAPHWQVRVLNPGGPCDQWLISVEPACIRPLPSAEGIPCGNMQELDKVMGW